LIWSIFFKLTRKPASARSWWSICSPRAIAIREKIGIAMFAQGIEVVLAQTPAGAIVDAFRTKGMMIAPASLAVAAVSVAIVHLDGLATVVTAQVAVGIS